MSSSATQSIHPNHVKLLGQTEVARLSKLRKGLDLSKHDEQVKLFDRVQEHPEIIKAIGKRPEFKGHGISAADVTIEFLIVTEGVAMGAIAPELRLNPGVNSDRRLHLAKEAHERLKQASVCEEAVA